MMKVHRAWFLSLLALTACGEPPPASDAGVDGGRPPFTVMVDGPDFAFLDEETCFVASAEGDASWRWGDGATGEGTSACHRWTVVGPLTIGVVVVDPDGRRAEATRLVTVVSRPSDPRPTWSSPIAIDAERGRLWVVNPDTNTVAVLSLAPFELVAEVEVGARPRTLAIAGDRVAVACQEEGVYFLDAETLSVVATVASTETYGVVADVLGRGFIASMREGRLATFSLEGAPLGSAATTRDARGLAMNADGTLLVTRWRGDGTAAHVSAHNLGDLTVPVLIGETMLPLQEGLDSDTDNSGVLSFLNQIVPSPDGRRALMPTLKANVVTGMFRTGEPLTSQTTARAALGEVLFGDGSEPARDSFRHSFDDLGFASAAVWSAMGDRVYVAMQGAQTVVVVDGFDYFTVASIDDVGEAPQGLALSPDGATLYVQAFLSRSVRAYDVSSFASEPALLGEVITVGTEPLSPQVLEGKRIFFRSRDPRMSRTRYLSCASCHLDGEGDALVWDFTQRGEGLRNTISLRGHAGAAPLHWSANFDEVQDFEHDIRGGQGGTGFLPDDVFHAMGRDDPLGTSKAGLSPELDALAAYVQSLLSFGTSDLTCEPADTAPGAALFADAAFGCNACHSGPSFTDSQISAGVPVLHDVGTFGAGSGMRLGAALTGLDTPTLRGLWRTAPYLHDGSAPTLRDVLTRRNPGDLHGATTGASDAEIDDLVTFLSCLDDRTP